MTEGEWIKCWSGRPGVLTEHEALAGGRWRVSGSDGARPRFPSAASRGHEGVSPRTCIHVCGRHLSDWRGLQRPPPPNQADRVHLLRLFAQRLHARARSWPRRVP